jgi:hypothetical protein
MEITPYQQAVAQAVVQQEPLAVLAVMDLLIIGVFLLVLAEQELQLQQVEVEQAEPVLPTRAELQAILVVMAFRVAVEAVIQLLELDPMAETVVQV